MNVFARIGLSFCLFLFASLCVLSQGKPGSKAKPQLTPLSAQEIAKRFLPSVVLIVCDDGKGKVSQGSGFFIEIKREPVKIQVLGFGDETGNLTDPRAKESPGLAKLLPQSSEKLVLTNYHVIEGMVRGKAKVAIGGKDSSEWWIDSIEAVDEANDLALLRLVDWKIIDYDKPLDSQSEKPPRLPNGLSFSTSTDLNIGEDIYVLSNPKGLSGTLSKGIISGSARQVNGRPLVQIDAPISSGSSGGAVLNTRGEVIGIATGSFNDGQNLNFAVPTSSIYSFLAQFNIATQRIKTDAVIQNGWSETVRFEELKSDGLKYQGWALQLRKLLEVPTASVSKSIETSDCWLNYVSKESDSKRTEVSWNENVGSIES